MNPDQTKFFAFIRQCAILLGIQDKPEESALIKDDSWFWRYDDGLTPEQAVEEYGRRSDD